MIKQIWITSVPLNNKQMLPRGICLWLVLYVCFFFSWFFSTLSLFCIVAWHGKEKYKLHKHTSLPKCKFQVVFLNVSHLEVFQKYLKEIKLWSPFTHLHHVKVCMKRKLQSYYFPCCEEVNIFEATFILKK